MTAVLDFSAIAALIETPRTKSRHGVPQLPPLGCRSAGRPLGLPESRSPLRGLATTLSRAKQDVVDSTAFPIHRFGRRISLEEIGKILPRVFERRAAQQDAGLSEFLAAVWGRVAGTAVAAHSRPVALTGGALTLAVSSAAWAVALRKMSEELRAAVNGYLGRAAVRKLRIVVSAGSSMAEASAPNARSYEVRDETVARLERTLASISLFPKG